MRFGIRIPKPSIESITWLSLFLFLFVSNFAKHSLIFEVAAIFLLIMGVLYTLTKKKIHFSIYFAYSLLFILYNIMLIVTKNAVDPSNAFEMVKTLVFNIIIGFVIFNFVINSNNIEKLFKIYCLAAFLGLLVIMIIFKDTLFSGRLAFAWGEASYYLWGQGISISPNAIAFNVTTALLFTTYFFIKEKKFRYITYNSFFVLGIFLTGSRKGLLFFLLSFFFLLNILYPKKRIQVILISILVSLLVLIALTEIPVLYNIIGQRLGELFVFALGGETSEQSINTRMQLVDMAIGLIKEKPIVGYGLDAFREMTPYGIVSDNNFLELLVSSGIIGLILYYLPVINLFFKFIILSKKTIVLKILFTICFLNLIMETGSVTYFERSYMLFLVFPYAIFKLNRIAIVEVKKNKRDLLSDKSNVFIAVGNGKESIREERT